MPKRLKPAVTIAALLVGAALTHAAGAEALSFSPCAPGSQLSCATLQVPLERGGLPGSITLHLARRLSGSLPAQGAVVALAGGPGQAAIPLAEFFAHDMAPALRTRDLITFDQRGTGESDPLECRSLNGGALAPNLAAGYEQCALQIGPARGAYTSAESAEDIEAVRTATGYGQLVLFGTSYGTRVALQYATRYPQHVEAMVLDSVVPPEGPEPFGVPTMQAIAPVLAELCSNHACDGITRAPLSELAALARRLHAHVLSGSVYDGAGRRHHASLNELGLLNILEAGDLNPTLRAMLPSAVRSALENDPDPLLRLHLLSEGLAPNVPGASRFDGARRELATGISGDVDQALFVTTSCEEIAFPWQRSSPPARRRREALAALAAVPSADFYPFDSATAWQAGLAPACTQWPFSSPTPPAVGALPNVPTLILSGSQDLRTPAAYARRVARLIPDAHLVRVPFTGHSVMGSDFSGCAKAAVTAFFSTGVVQPCVTATNTFGPTPPSPISLGYVKAIGGVVGRPGRTLTAVLETITDLARQVIGAALQADQLLPSGSSFGGLRGGYARISPSTVQLSHFSFVPGVQLSGTFPVRAGKLQPARVRVSGSQAAHGAVVLGAGERVAGTLGHRHFNLSLARSKLSRAARAPLGSLQSLAGTGLAWPGQAWPGQA